MYGQVTRDRALDPWLSRPTEGHKPMERIGNRTYRCTTCDAVVQLETDDSPVVVLAAQTGRPNERVVTAGGVEVHRCPFPMVGTSRRAVQLTE